MANTFRIEPTMFMTNQEVCEAVEFGYIGTIQNECFGFGEDGMNNAPALFWGGGKDERQDFQPNREQNILFEPKYFSMMQKALKWSDIREKYMLKPLKNKTKIYVVKKIYLKQIEGSEKRGHAFPEYSALELQDWLFEQNKFHKLYDAWVEAGYEKDLVPSVDRIDSKIGYTMSNIQLMTWDENNKKGILERQLRVVAKYEDGSSSEYESIQHASKDLNIDASSISKVCRGKRETAGGIGWEYV